MHKLQMNLLPSPTGQKMVTTGSSSTLDKDGSSMFSQILAHLPKYTLSSWKNCNLHIHWYENLRTH